MGSNQHFLDKHKQTKATSLENNIKWKQKVLHFGAMKV